MGVIILMGFIDSLRNLLKRRLKYFGSWVYYRLNQIRDIDIIRTFDFGLNDVNKTKKMMDEYTISKKEIRTINWLMTNFDHHLFAGIYTILRFADYFSRKKGIINRIIIIDRPDANLVLLKKKIGRDFPALVDHIYAYDGSDLQHLPNSDINIATYWTTAYFMIHIKNTRAKFYFIQDFEPLFYPGGVTYGLVEATYRLGYWGIANTDGLASVLKNSYGMKVNAFRPAVDPDVYYPAQNRSPIPIKIFFYGRPGNVRNGFILGIEALKKVKKEFGERVQIVTAGGKWNPSDFGVQGIIQNLGLIAGVQEIAEFYRSCHIGLVFMFTKHPSYLPIELMASGVAVVTNNNSATSWLLKHEKNSLVVEPTVTSVAESISRLVVDDQLREAIILQGIKTSRETCWDAEIESVYKFLIGETI